MTINYNEAEDRSRHWERVDPIECGCTDCITGYSVNFDLLLSYCGGLVTGEEGNYVITLSPMLQQRIKAKQYTWKWDGDYDTVELLSKALLEVAKS